MASCSAFYVYLVLSHAWILPGAAFTGIAVCNTNIANSGCL